LTVCRHVEELNRETLKSPRSALYGKVIPRRSTLADKAGLIREARVNVRVADDAVEDARFLQLQISRTEPCLSSGCWQLRQRVLSAPFTNHEMT